MESVVIDWLLESKNPAVKYRTETEILRKAADNSETKKWIFAKLPKDWFEIKGLWYIYYLTALAESGLTKADIPSEYTYRALSFITNEFTFSCSDFMLLRALVKLGYHDNEEIKNTLNRLIDSSLPDGGFLCESRLKKFSCTPKSCYKADVFALLLLAECLKKDITPDYGSELTEYFINRNIFYKSDKSALIFDGQEGGRSIDVFYPFEPMRVGIQNIIEALSAVGLGNDEKLNEAWQLMYRKKDENGKLILSGTLTKSYLPKETAGKPSKWATFYMLLAEKERKING